MAWRDAAPFRASGKVFVGRWTFPWKQLRKFLRQHEFDEDNVVSSGVRTEQGMVIRFQASANDDDEVFLMLAVKFEKRRISPPNWRFVTHLIEPYCGLNQQPFSDFPHCKQQGGHMCAYHERGVSFGDIDDTMADTYDTSYRGSRIL